jgi:dipeptidyl aminopeptidase/acylaminoacyl peptidase
MTRTRISIFLSTVFIVLGIGLVLSLYARGYRFDFDKTQFTPNGLLVIKSDPDGGQVFVNGELKTATNATIPLAPAIYDIRVQKEGYISWSKRLKIDKEIVTESTAHLFKSAPSLSSITFSSSINPTPSRDFSKIAYAVPLNLSNNNEEKSGLWVMEMINLPLGFSREPQRITDSDLTDADWQWSPDGREILVIKKTGVFLLNSGEFTPQTRLVNVASQKEESLSQWEEELAKKQKSQLARLPDELATILTRKSSAIIISPDEDMILYTASGSATIPDELIKPVPGASTQKEERNIEFGNTYVYDIKEDRNFIIDSEDKLIIKGGFLSLAERRLSWLPTSRHLILAEKEKVIILDYDGTNRQTVYAGSYVAPNALPTLSTDRLIILTNLGANSSPPNLYSLSIK